MKIIKLLLVFVLVVHTATGQYPKGEIIVDRIFSPSLENQLGEEPTRRVTVYLPPGYKNTKARYPVIYYLHGFSDSDSLPVTRNRFDQLLDMAIGTGKIKPVIVVIPNHHTLYRGSFYTNSSLAGNWADFTALDLVDHIDKNYRTIAGRESRGVTGHSMGGHGAIKMGMLFPDVFASVYALSPALLGLSNEFGINSQAYRRVSNMRTREEVVTEFIPNVIVALGRAFSPNPDNPPFYADLPYSYKGDSLIIDYSVIELWNRNLPAEMVFEYVANLKRLKALKLDWGRNEEFIHIPLTSRIFSQRLENLGISHYAEEYLGTHSNKLWTDDGRVLNNMLPFFDFFLNFGDW
jgi:S-formylglutathione hydrolase FrmB